MINRTTLAAAAAAALLASPLVAQDAKKTATGADRTFVTGAANGGMLEIQSSELANIKAQRDDVKSFASTLIKDHTKANEELKAAAQKAGITVPSKMDTKHQAQMDRLKAATAANFDRAFIDTQVTAHREAVGLFRDYSKTGRNDALRTFAERTLPVLEQHETTARDMQKEGSPATGAGAGAGSTGKSK
ncbi:MAG: DUF4142 domain-containing protein [Hyphomicrobiaceae bacterium]|nr:DUF4142 domain-containing protein [Hyphomicrobiaceae bacterium]